VLLDVLGQNLLHSWRHLRRKPSFCIVVIATTALGIGVNTAIFSLTYGLLLRPFPYASPDQLVRLRTDSTRPGQAGVVEGQRAWLNREQTVVLKKWAEYGAYGRSLRC
jgi:putative ABC transport system permease protein